MTSEICESQHRGNPLVSCEMALSQLLARVQSPERPIESMPLLACLDRVLAKAISLDRSEPPLPRSAMDGFALRSEDQESPRELLSTVYAGTAEVPSVGVGQAVAVMTGGTVPPGADAVVPVELTEVEGGVLRIQETPMAGRHVRQAGEMGAKGREVLHTGQRMTSADLTAAAGCGAKEVQVFPKPRVVILSTGDEVVPWDTLPKPHQVRDSNRVGVAFQVESFGGQVVEQAHIPDDPVALETAVADALALADLVITIGGVSMGQKDHLPGVFEKLQVEKLFHGVSVQPGKPVWAGCRHQQFVLGLPGNPISSFVILEILGRPLLEKMSNQISPESLQPQAGVLLTPATSKKRPRYLPATLSVQADGRVGVRVCGESGSGDWSALAGATALLCLPPRAQQKVGDAITYLSLG